MGSYKRLWWTLLLVIVAAVATAVVVGLSAAFTALDAEKTLHAYYLVLQITDDYQQSHDGQWPPNWRALEQIPYNRESMWRWPDDAKDIQERIKFDFEVDSEEVTLMSPDKFPAIQQREPCFHGTHEARIGALIASLKESLGKKKSE